MITKNNYSLIIFYAIVNMIVSLSISELIIPYLEIVNLKNHRIIVWSSTIVGAFLSGVIIFLIGYSVGNLYYFFSNKKRETNNEKLLLEVFVNKLIKFSILFEFLRTIIILVIIIFIISESNSNFYLKLFNQINYIYYILLPFLLFANLNVLKKT